jgi:hypothetical protein
LVEALLSDNLQFCLCAAVFPFFLVCDAHVELGIAGIDVYYKQ